MQHLLHLLHCQLFQDGHQERAPYETDLRLPDPISDFAFDPRGDMMLKIQKVYKRSLIEDWRASAIVIGANLSITGVLLSILLGYRGYSLPLILIVLPFSALWLRGRRMLVLFNKREIIFWSAVNLGLLASFIALFW
jgi:hypothetical protein